MKPTHALASSIRSSRLTISVLVSLTAMPMDSISGARWLSERGVRLRFLFLDGAHDEQSVRADLQAFLPLMLPGSWIALDDARPDGPFPGVYRAYESLLKPRAREVAWGGPMLLVQLSS